jgi:hypothetical protein
MGAVSLADAGCAAGAGGSVRLMSVQGAAVPQPGSEVAMNYGDKGNEELLMLYGFVQDSNEHDYVMVQVGGGGELVQVWCVAGPTLSYNTPCVIQHTLCHTTHSGMCCKYVLVVSNVAGAGVLCCCSPWQSFGKLGGGYTAAMQAAAAMHAAHRPPALEPRALGPRDDVMVRLPPLCSARCPRATHGTRRLRRAWSCCTRAACGLSSSCQRQRWARRTRLALVARPGRCPRTCAMSWRWADQPPDLLPGCVSAW